MPKSRNLSIEDRSAVVTLIKKGYSGRHIARKVNFSICTVQNILKKNADIGTVVDRARARSKRPRAITQREDRSLIRLSDRKASSNCNANFKIGQDAV